MMSIFLNPGFLAVAAALVSVPIIIHLINRMRFKRIRWAAMEFLLKAQKRKRKRLIIEQLLLLFLRCLLVALFGFLVSRFVSSAFANLGSKPHLHVVVLDDTLSMREEWEDEGKLKGKRTAFQNAIQDQLIKEIGQGLKSANATDELVVVPVSRLVNETDFQPTYFKSFNDEGKFKEFEEEVKRLEPTMVHVPMGATVKKLAALIEARQNNRITLHFISDWRDDDWNPKSKTGYKELAALTNKHPDLFINVIDAVQPKRDRNEVGVSRDNVAIVDLRSTTRVVSKNMRMEFVMKLANFSSQEKYVNVQVFDELSGKERLDVNFRGSMPVKVPANTLDVPVAFDLPPFDERKDLPYRGGHVFISARLMSPANKYNPLENDGLPTDNRRYASVEVRENVPVLLVDGRGKVTKDETGQDWFYLNSSFESAPSANYKVVFGEEIGRGVPERALERTDELSRFSSVYLLNVASLKPEQVASLESYVAAGGGVAFFMGPDVSKDLYNKVLYKEGKGVFPVELIDVITAKLPTAKADEDPKGKKKEEESQDLILRERQFPDLDKYPIFGRLLRDGMNQRNFENVNVSKYFRVKRPEPMAAPEEKDDKKKEEELKTWDVTELATLPSEETINFKVTSTVSRVLFGTTEAGATLEDSKAPVLRVLKNAKLARWKKGIENHRDGVRRVMESNLGKKVYHLARPLNYMLTDPGAKKKEIEKKDGKEVEREVEDPEAPDMTELWSSSDPDVKALRQQILNLYDEFAYGDPFIIASRYGRGRVVVVLSSSGPRWSGWSVAGSPDNPTAFPVVLEELQKYLASQGSEATYTVGTDLKLSVDTDVFKKRSLPHQKVKRVFMKPVEDKPAEVVFKDDILGVEKEGSVSFSLPSVKEPGISVTELLDAREKEAIASVVHVFNVDALSEGALDRVSGFKQLKDEARPGSVNVIGAGGPPPINPQTVLTESAVFFLILILLLVAEQALAVHLSFHTAGEGGRLSLPGQALTGSRAA
ncbi:MAG: BatA domain-containing protein [Gemmataceae bacterium]